MDASITAKQTRSEQCRKNAQAKSEQKRQATFSAIQSLKLEKLPVTRASVARRAGVSAVFLRSHADLLQAIGEAERQYRITPPDQAADRGKDQVTAALRRRLDEMKQQVTAKDRELREKQREIDRLYGKLAAGSQLVDPEVRQRLTAALERVAALENQEASHRG